MKQLLLTLDPMDGGLPFPQRPSPASVIAEHDELVPLRQLHPYLLLVALEENHLSSRLDMSQSRSLMNGCGRAWWIS